MKHFDVTYKRSIQKLKGIDLACNHAKFHKSNLGGSRVSLGRRST